jgi:23S rRNA (pseudouridine1915-N3)-methyltransferase
MKITLIQVGKTTEKHIIEGFAIYEKRLKHYCSFSVVNVSASKSSSPEFGKEEESNAIFAAIDNKDFVVLLDEKGEILTSRKFAEFILQKGVSGISKIVFVIGGAYGFSEKIYKRANFLLSLSAMTFPHQLIRLLFIEQLYRAFTITKGEKYHHD